MFNMISLFNAMSSVEIPEAQDESGSLLNADLTDAPVQSPANKAIVTRTIEPGISGQVKFQGTWWNARCEQNITLRPGQTVYVVSEWSSIPLLVEPAQAASLTHFQDAA
ncbi:NfeD family protein [Kovacikia minuta CCNUW1]|uniref:NfeD family protein n=1 Tax=Kovacikia minuta TaxID=2931930 RepID=UPI001CCF75D3|nr:NfeD family protein [Kovacikia minuta]UBF24539.1 NfeD family protein [Kovacikia minuta CCNUW1]